MALSPPEITLYLRSARGYVRVETHQIAFMSEWKDRYGRAISILFREREVWRVTNWGIATNSPTVILKGWGHTSLERVSSSDREFFKYPVFDERWLLETDALLNHYLRRLSPDVVIADYRVGLANEPEPKATTGEEMAEEVRAVGEFVEGAVRVVTVNAFERSAGARRACIEHYGAVCAACSFDFGATYGEVSEGFIHVHHVVPLASVRASYVVDPVKDLRPVCPNCHAVIHRREPPYSIEEVKAFLSKASEMKP